MRQLPSGIVTLLFTDMEGSTRLLQQLGERYVDLLKECRRLLRAAFQQCSGYEVDTQGDAFFIVFERALDAVSAAAIAQSTLSTAKWPENVRVSVRMGIHTGEPHATEEGYVGMEVHHAARIMGAARGGQVLLSQVTRDLVADELPTGVTLWDLGEHRLKDIVGRTRLFQLALPGLPNVFPLSLPADSQRLFPPLPSPTTSFVGREQEVAAVFRQLCQSDVRLLTLIGPAGVGKTRLALHAATLAAAQFASNLAFVSLEQVTAADAVLPAIAQALNIQEPGASSLIQQIKKLLHEQPFLLILDNFEQIVEARLTIAQLLTECPRLKICITSRILLNIQAEHLFEVQPLPLPDDGVPNDYAELSQYAAIALFVQRAQAVAPHFRLTPANAGVVQEICARLDGIPLALELAAARLRHTPLATVHTQLLQGLGTLKGDKQDIAERQRTLQSAIAWSYQLLAPTEQRVFRRLAVFANGATLEAAQQVCVTDEGSADIAEILSALVDKSMVQRQDGQETRFRLLQTLSAYGKEQMIGAEEWHTTQKQHAAYYLDWLERLAPLLVGAQQAHWLDRLDQEYDNIRAALTWTLTQAREERAQAEQALRWCTALQGYWEVRGHLKEGLAFVEQALACTPGIAPSLRAQALYNAGFLALLQDERTRAEHFLQECQALFRESGDKTGMANILRLQGNLACSKDMYKLGRRLLEEALDMYQEQGEVRKSVSTREALAQVAMVQGEYAKARALSTKNLSMYRELNEVYGTAYPLYNLARGYFLSLDDLAAAQTLAEESLASFKAVGNRRLAAYVLNLLGQIALISGTAEQVATARPMLTESLDIFKAIGDRAGAVETLLVLAHAASKQGETQEALHAYQEAWSLLQTSGDKELVALCLEGCGQVAIAQNMPEQAVKLWGTAATIRATIVAPLPPAYRAAYRTALASARASLAAETFQSCWQQGHQTPWEQVNPLI